MDIDLDQLPIPDWGLKCPRCEYALRGLPSHCCPECGLTLSMTELIKPWTRLRAPTHTGEELPIPNYGLHCRRCSAPLAGATTSACPKCGEPADLRAARPRDAWFPADEGSADLAGASALQALLFQKHIPHLRSGNRAGSDVLLARGVGAGVLYISSEFYFDYLVLIQSMSSSSEKKTENLPEWACRACHEMCPANFEMCWNCGANRHDRLQSDLG